MSLLNRANPSLTREQAKAIVDRVLAMSTADEARVNIQSGWQGNTRFAGGQITTGGGTVDTVVTITSTIGKKSASAQTNLLDDASLKRAVDLSERLARLSPDDPEYMPELGPQEYATVNAWVPATAELGPEARAQAVGAVFQSVLATTGIPAGTADDAVKNPVLPGLGPNMLFVGGYLEANASATAVATSKGLFAYHASTDANLSTTVRTPDGTGSGYAVAGARDWSKLDPAAVGRRAAQKAIASRNPVAIEPGRYTVILEPTAVGNLVQPYLMSAFNARTADEGRGAFSKRGGGNKVGEKIADERITLLADPSDADILGSSFDGQGLPVRRRVYIENGVLKGLNYSRYWAQRQSVEPTGFGGGLKMLGGTKSVDQLVAETERGILVTRFWYIRFLDPRTVLVTGLTRDGTFLVENGKITKPIKNLRFNESPLFMINKVDELGQAERIDAGVVMPSMKVRDFTFTSLSDAV